MNVVIVDYEPRSALDFKSLQARIQSAVKGVAIERLAGIGHIHCGNLGIDGWEWALITYMYATKRVPHCAII
jgi:hypothetical protein